MADHVKRIEAVEKKVKLLGEEGAVKEDVKKLRAETKKVYVSQVITSLSCRATPSTGAEDSSRHA
jgi:hypothetical protein